MSRYKYGSQHQTQCTCDRCQDMLALHKVQRGGIDCVCEDCFATRSQLAVIAETEERGRQFRMNLIREGQPVSTINICDRPECGSMTKSNVMGAVEFNTGDGTDQARTYGHLCPACVGDLVSWWESAVGERDKAYSKPWSRPKATDDPTRMNSAQLFQLALEASKAELES